VSAQPEMPRHLPPPWKADKIAGGYVVRDANGHGLRIIGADARPNWR
jgi:hypothetical protein